MKVKFKKWEDKFKCPCGGTVIQLHWKSISGGGFSWKSCNKCTTEYKLKDVENGTIKPITN